MLTGKSYDALAGMIGWAPEDVHYSTWKELTGVLSALGWDIGEPRKAAGWSDVSGLSVVHVEPDHFMLYDAENGDFYDPAQLSGPERESSLVPMSYLTVRPPE
ncbi:hypothetical protein IM737_11375 [Devosia sp. SL43]|nr:hypothetical protein IM737_11375 [Devosia sp. SL43]